MRAVCIHPSIPHENQARRIQPMEPAYPSHACIMPEVESSMKRWFGSLAAWLRACNAIMHIRTLQYELVCTLFNSFVQHPPACTRRTASGHPPRSHCAHNTHAVCRRRRRLQHHPHFHHHHHHRLQLDRRRCTFLPKFLSQIHVANECGLHRPRSAAACRAQLRLLCSRRYYQHLCVEAQHIRSASQRSVDSIGVLCERVSE
jgi:hypothetical protein